VLIICSVAFALSHPLSRVRSLTSAPVVSKSCTLLHVMHSVVHALPRTTVIMSLGADWLYFTMFYSHLNLTKTYHISPQLSRRIRFTGG